MALNPAFKGNRGVAGVAAGGAVLLPPPLLPPPTTWSTAALLWFRNFSSRRHFALRLLNHTCNRRNDGAFVTIRGVVTLALLSHYISSHTTFSHISLRSIFSFFARAHLLFPYTYPPRFPSLSLFLSAHPHTLPSHAIPSFLVRFCYQVRFRYPFLPASVLTAIHPIISPLSSRVLVSELLFRFFRLGFSFWGIYCLRNLDSFFSFFLGLSYLLNSFYGQYSIVYYI